MARTAAFWAAPSALLAWSWLRLSQPHAAASTALWLIALALAPALLPRPRQRVLALVPASVLALHVALGVWLVHPLRLLGRFGGGFLEFYDVRLPFATPLHPRMEGVILVALFAFCACLGVVVAARRPALAALVLVVGVGWPATLLTGPDDLLRGVLLLAAALSLIAGLGGPLQPRRLLLAGVALGAIVLAAFAASTSPAPASRSPSGQAPTRSPTPRAASPTWKTPWRRGSATASGATRRSRRRNGSPRYRPATPSKSGLPISRWSRASPRLHSALPTASGRWQWSSGAPLARTRPSTGRRGGSSASPRIRMPPRSSSRAGSAPEPSSTTRGRPKSPASRRSLPSSRRRVAATASTSPVRWR